MPAKDDKPDRPEDNVRREGEGKKSDFPARDRFPSFHDPAFSAEPPEPLVKSPAPPLGKAPKDNRFEGHPDFDQEAAKNRPPAEDQARRGK